MKYVLFFLLGYVVLYAVVWLHEVGHALWYRRFNLKNDWWNVQVKPYIFFSTPGGVDLDVWNTLKPIQYVLIGYGGLMANALMAIIAGAIIAANSINNEYLIVVLWLFMTLHIGEIVSYLFIGSIYLVSDMQAVNQQMPKLRIPNIILGALIAALYVFLLARSPENYRIFIVGWNVATVISMCAGRIIFTARASKAIEPENG